MFSVNQNRIALLPAAAVNSVLRPPVPVSPFTQGDESQQQQERLFIRYSTLFLEFPVPKLPLAVRRSLMDCTGSLKPFSPVKKKNPLAISPDHHSVSVRVVDSQTAVALLPCAEFTLYPRCIRDTHF